MGEYKYRFGNLYDMICELKKNKIYFHRYSRAVLNKYTYLKGLFRYAVCMDFIQDSFYIDKYNNVKLANENNVEEDYKNNNLPDAYLNIRYEFTAEGFINHLTRGKDMECFALKPYPLLKDYDSATAYSYEDKKMRYYHFVKEEPSYDRLLPLDANQHKAISVGNGAFGEYIYTSDVVNGDLVHNKYPVNLSTIDPDRIEWTRQYFPSVICLNGPYAYVKPCFSYPSLLISSNEVQERRYIWLFDFETTGLDPTIDEILEIGLGIYEINRQSRKLNLVDKFSCLRNVKISKEVSDLTHITQKMIDDEALEDNQIIDSLKELQRKYDNNNIFASYNLYFDASFFIKFCKLNSISFNFDWLDILTIVRDRFDYPHKLVDILDTLKKIYGQQYGFYVQKYIGFDLNQVKQKKRYNDLVKVSNSHRAIDDVEASAKVLEIMMEDFDDIVKYVGLIGHVPKYKFKKNGIIDSFISSEGIRKGKITTRVQFFKREYPLYYHEQRDIDLYYSQNRNNSDDIIDCVNDLNTEIRITDF